MVLLSHWLAQQRAASTRNQLSIREHQWGVQPTVGGVVVLRWRLRKEAAPRLPSEALRLAQLWAMGEPRGPENRLGAMSSRTPEP